MSEDEGTYMKITVTKGDSLWSISEQYAEQFGLATPEFVKLLERENHLTSNLIKSGEELVVPITLKQTKKSEVEFAFQMRIRSYFEHIY